MGKGHKKRNSQKKINERKDDHFSQDRETKHMQTGHSHLSYLHGSEGLVITNQQGHGTANLLCSPGRRKHWHHPFRGQTGGILILWLRNSTYGNL